MTKKLAVIGGSYLQLPLVLKAKEIGVETHCFAWLEGAVCADYADFFYPISIIEKKEVLDVCQKVGIDGITTIASDTAVVTVNHVASRMNLVANPDEYTELTTNKYKMRECFLTNNIPSPKFFLIKNKKQSHSELSFPLIVKPTDRSGSRGVQKVFNPTEVEYATERAINESFEGKAIVEEYVAGREVSVESISWEGKHYILQITDKVTTGEPYFVELEHHQPSSLPRHSQNRIKTIVTQALDALHIAFGASHSELKITEDGDIKVIEIGARMGGDFIGSDLVQLSTGYDFLRGVIEIALGEFHKPIITKQLFSGVYFLSEERKNLKQIIDNWHKYPEIVKAEITNPELHRISCSGDRSGYLIYLTKSKTEADGFKQKMHSIL
jgi:biotin carboxylase